MTDRFDPPEDDLPEDDILAAELALGLLEAEEQAQAERRQRIDPEFAAKVADWQSRLSPMAEAIAPVTPPKALFKKIAGEAYPDSPKGLWRQLGLLPALLGAAAAALVLVVTLQFGLLTGPAEPSLVARVAAEDNSLVVAAAFVAETDTLFVERTTGAAASERVHELWLIAGDAAPVSLGLIEVSNSVIELAVPAEIAALLQGGVLAVSDEPAGGSPTGAPTGAVLAVGEITLL